MDIKKICKIADSTGNQIILESPDGTKRVVFEYAHDTYCPAKEYFFDTDITFVWSEGRFDRVDEESCVLSFDFDGAYDGDEIRKYAISAVQHYAEPDDIIAYFTGGKGSLQLYVNENGAYSFEGEDYECDADEALDALLEDMSFEDAMGILDPLVHNLDYGTKNISQGSYVNYFAYSENGQYDVKEAEDVFFAWLSGDVYEWYEEELVDRYGVNDGWEQGDFVNTLYGYDQVMDIIKTEYPDYKEI